MSILLFVNLKGGVAKTTNAVAVAECLADSGYRTLLIDADHQCMAGELLLGEERLLRLDHQSKTLHDLLAAMLDDEFSAKQIPNYVVGNASDIGGGLPRLSVMPCSIRIDDFSTNMARARRGYHSNDEFLAIFRRRREKLRRWLRKNYDFTIVDCPPSVALQVRVFLSVGDCYVIPAIPDRLSVRGSLYLLDRLQKLPVKLAELGTLWSLYRDQNPLHRRTLKLAAERIDPYFRQLPLPFETIIPNAAAIAEATEPGRRPRSFTAKYTSPFARLFHSVCEEIVKRSQWYEPKPKKENFVLTG
jgi:chromosome partitioning protein